MNKVCNFFVVMVMLFAQSNALFSMESEHGQDGQAGKKASRKRSRSDVDVRDDVKQPKIEVNGTQMGCNSSLKQASYEGHGLHCGYYALWNALCGVNPDFQGENTHREDFNKHLETWENIVFQRRAPQEACFVNIFRGPILPSEVNNLQVEELDLLVNRLVQDTLLPVSHAEQVTDGVQAASNVTVFASKNQIAQLATGHGLTPALLDRIRKFRADTQPQAFIINTGNARDERQVGTFHWIAAVLTPHSAPTEEFAYELKFYDSGYVPRSRENKKDFDQYCKSLIPMGNSIHALFVEENLDLLTARSLLTPQLHAVKVYSDQYAEISNASNDILLWSCDVYSDEYIYFLEDYVRCCIRAAAPDRFNELNAKMALRRAKRIDNNDYAKFLRRKTIPVMQAQLKSLFLDPNWTQFEELNVHIGTLQACARQLAINKLAKTYGDFVVTGQVTQDAFIQVAHEAGISHEIIDAGIAQVEDPLVINNINVITD